MFPSVALPIINLPMLGAKINNIIKAIKDIIDIILTDSLYVSFMALLYPRALYSLVILLIAKGNPALEIPKNN